MKTWVGLYLMIWVVFLEFLVLLVPLDRTVAVPLHIALGLIILALAVRNTRAVATTAAPARIKRITRATMNLAIAQPILGLPLLVLAGIPDTFVSILHMVVAFAIITQAASAATGYDMWEEKEWLPTAPEPAAATALSPAEA